MRNIYLIGFMGTGKTTVGRELARRAARPFLDLDDLIELTARRSISDIFAKEGEAAFRRLEKKILAQASREKGFVIACGGGIVMDQDNIRTMKDTGTIICLVATPQVILQRTRAQAHRPLLNVSDPEKQIDLLLKLRAPYYAQADKVVDTAQLTPAQVVDRIIRAGAAKKQNARKRKPKAK